MFESDTGNRTGAAQTNVARTGPAKLSNIGSPVSAGAIGRAWAQAKSGPLPCAVPTGPLSQQRLYARFAGIYPQLLARPRHLRRRLQRTLGTSLAGVALALALGHAAPAEAADIFVNENCAAVRGGSECTLKDAIVSANTDSPVGGCAPGSSADTIHLSCGSGVYDLYTVDNSSGSFNANGLPVINSSVTIEGNGATIRRVDGGATRGGATPEFRILSVGFFANTGSLTLNDTTISGGQSPGLGGGIFCYRGELTLNDSTVTGNNASFDGGGIQAQRLCNVAINNSTVAGNHSSSNYSSGGGIVATRLIVNKSTISGNSAGSSGGGIANEYYSGQLSITDTTIADNQARRGGGVWWYMNNMNVSIVNSTITGNNATAGAGGGLNFEGGYYSSDLAVINSTVSGNSATSAGGGIDVRDNNNLNVTGSIVSGNAAPTGSDIRRTEGNYAPTAFTAFNIFGDNASTTAGSVSGFTPSALDILATSDGTNPTALGDILETVLADNGGPTQTLALVSGSPAIDAASQPACPPTDQRGVSRPQGAECDIGAFELDVFDDDGDGVDNTSDLCPATPGGQDVDAAGCSDAQVDGDGDGVCDPGAPSVGPSECIGSDNCPDDANAFQDDFDDDGEGDVCDADIDGDSVANGADLCPLTVIPEDTPTNGRLGKNRWALDESNGLFFNQAPPQNESVFQFDITSTGGCTCEQIVMETGSGQGHVKNGCSTSLMLEWILTVPRAINP